MLKLMGRKYNKLQMDLYTAVSRYSYITDVATSAIVQKYEKQSLDYD
jgi:hypothetical protein